MLLTYESYAEIPEKLHLFYSNAFDTLFYKHDATKGGYKRELKSNLTYDNFKRVFETFSFKTYAKNQYEFTYDSLNEILKDISIKLQIKFNSNKYIHDIIYSLCLISKDGLTYSFTHRSFQEYFTALYIKNLNDVNQEKVSRFLIEKENKLFTLNSDMVFKMLLDMNKERFEGNILIPLLEIVEKDIINKDFDTYYNMYIESIAIKENSLNIAKITRSDNTINNIRIKRFLFDMIHQYYDESYYSDDEDDEDDEDYKKNIREYITSVKNTDGFILNHDYIELKNGFVLGNQDLVDFISKTWIGTVITTLISFKDVLVENQKKYNYYILDELI